MVWYAQNQTKPNQSYKYVVNIYLAHNRNPVLQCGHGSNANEGILNIPQSFRIEASRKDAV